MHAHKFLGLPKNFFLEFLPTYCGVMLGCVRAIYCCAESVQNHDWIPSAHYFGPKGFTK